MRIEDLFGKSLSDMTEEELNSLISSVRNDRAKTKIPGSATRTRNATPTKDKAAEAFVQLFQGMGPKERDEFLKQIKEKNSK